MSGVLEFVLVNGRTTAKEQFSRYPLRFMLPKKVTRLDCEWVYMLNFGGGLLGGDKIDVTCTVGAGCTVALATQGSTKVFKARPGLPASQQSLQVKIHEGAVLALLPDPVTCFADALYRQCQDFHIDQGGNLVLVDWFTGGRVERGEAWQFRRLETCNRVYVGGELVFWEPLVLEGGPESVAARMGQWRCCCTLIVMGPKLRPVLDRIRGQQTRGGFEDKILVGGHNGGVSSSAGSSSTSHDGPNHVGVKRPLSGSSSANRGGPVLPDGRKVGISSVCPLLCEGDGVVFKAATTTTEDMYVLLHYLLQPMQSLIGREPFVNHVVVAGSPPCSTTGHPP